MNQPATMELRDLDEASWETLEQAVTELEQSWSSPHVAELLALVPQPDDPIRIRVLIELIKVDQEHRWKLGQPKFTEDYLNEWPELATQRQVVTELLEAESLTRGIYDRFPTGQELDARFGSTAAYVDLNRIKRQVEDEEGGKSRVAEVGLSVGQKLGRYEIRDLLGCGGMGTVYRAFDADLGVDVALKIPRTSIDHRAIDRISAEARTLASIRHPNVCPVFDVGKIGGHSYIAMALILGESLASHIGTDGLESVGAAELVSKLCRALQSVHETDAIHRDIKPTNVMIDQAGEPILMDFGLAGQANGSDPGSLDNGDDGEDVPAASSVEISSDSSILAGTLAYMSPEQAAGKAVDARSDIFSMGILLYETLTGQRPFGGSWTQVICDVRRAAPALPRTIRSDIPARLEAICMKAMSANPEDRFATAETMADALTDFADSYSRPKTRQRLRYALTITIAMVLFIVAILVFFKTGHGTLRVVGLDTAGHQMTIDGQPVAVVGAGDTMPMSVGEHVIEITVESGMIYRTELTFRWRYSQHGLQVSSAGLVPIDRWIGTDWDDADFFQLAPHPDGTKLLAVLHGSEGVHSAVRMYQIESDQPSTIVPFNFNTPLFDNFRPTPKTPSDFRGIAVQGPYCYLSQYYAPFSHYVSRINLETKEQKNVAVCDLKSDVWADSIHLTPDRKTLLVEVGRDGRAHSLGNEGVSVFDIGDGRLNLSSFVRLEHELASQNIAFTTNSQFAYVVTRKRRSSPDVAEKSSGQDASNTFSLPAAPTLYELALAADVKRPRSLAFPDSKLGGVAVSSRLDRIYVSDAKQRKIHVVHRSSFECDSAISIEGGRRPVFLEIYEPSNLMAVQIPDNDAIHFFNLSTQRMVGQVVGLRQSWRCPPKFSPDGRRLYVAAKRSADGKNGVAVLNVESLLTSIVFASNRGSDNHELYAMAANGKSVVQLTKNTAMDRSPRWSPDGKQIAFLSDREGDFHVCIYNVVNGETKVLAQTHPLFAADNGPTLDWSPNGKRIAFVNDSRKTIDIVTLASDQIDQLAISKITRNLVKGLSNCTAICWRRSDGAILFEANNKADGDFQDLFVIWLGQKKARQLTDHYGDLEVTCGRPCASPDGNRIAILYQNIRADGCARRFALLNSDGADMKILNIPIHPEMYSPQWFPDGKRFLFTAKVNGHRQIFCASIDGGKPTRLTIGNSDSVEPDICIGNPVPLGISWVVDPAAAVDE